MLDYPSGLRLTARHVRYTSTYPLPPLYSLCFFFCQVFMYVWSAFFSKFYIRGQSFPFLLCFSFNDPSLSFFWPSGKLIDLERTSCMHPPHHTTPYTNAQQPNHYLLPLPHYNYFFHVSAFFLAAHCPHCFLVILTYIYIHNMQRTSRFWFWFPTPESYPALLSFSLISDPRIGLGACIKTFFLITYVYIVRTFPRRIPPIARPPPSWISGSDSIWKKIFPSPSSKLFILLFVSLYYFRNARFPIDLGWIWWPVRRWRLEGDLFTKLWTGCLSPPPHHPM